MIALAVSVSVVLVVSALCSLAEASVYAVRLPFVKGLADSGKASGRILSSMKENMERPISTILIVNTVANTAGAAVAGAQAEALLGSDSLIWFSACFTMAVLVCSEIVPKVIGVAYSNQVAILVALPLQAATKMLTPMVWCVEKMSTWLKPEGKVFSAPEEEVHQVAQMSADEGSILPLEANLVQNVLQLDDINAGEIMTPRTVVQKFASDVTVRDAIERTEEWNHSRMPLVSPDDPDEWQGFVLRRDILTRMARDDFDTKLSELAKPMHFVSTETKGHVLLQTFLRRRSHMFGVVDEFGGMAGVVTFEDVLESLLGEEIVDETDQEVDMQEVARSRRRQQFDGRKPE